MGKRKRSRSKSSDRTEDLWKKLRKIEKKLKMRRAEGEEETPTRERSVSSSPETPPVTVEMSEKVPNTSEVTEDLAVEDIPEDLLEALGKEGENKEVIGEELQQQLAVRWTNIIHEGLGKEAREQLVKKYPTPANFQSAVPPIMNHEISASLNEVSIKRDKRIIFRQMLVGKMMVALGKTLSNILKGNINTKEMVEQLNDSAKIAAEVYHLDSKSRKFFALAGTTTVVKMAVKEGKTDEFLFGKNCGEQIKSAQTIQKTGAQIKVSDKKIPRQENWKGPLQPRPQHRSGQSYRPPGRTHTRQTTQRTQQTRKIPYQSVKPPRASHHRRN